MIATIAALVLVAACGGSPGETVPPGQVAQQGTKLHNPAVQGRAFPLNDKAILLAGQQYAIVALSDAPVAKSLGRPGDPAVVHGSVRRLNPAQARALGPALARLNRSSPRPAPRARILASPGDPYVQATAVKALGKGAKLK